MAYQQQQPVKQQPGVQQQTNVVVVQPVVQHKSGGGLFGSLEKAFNQAGKELDKAVDNVTHLTISDRLRPGHIVQLQSKLNNKSLRVLENGLVDCLSDGGTACHFLVLPGINYPNSIRLQNVAQPQKHLAIIKEYFVGYGQGGSDCELVASITVDGQFAMFESTIQPGAHIGALPSGQITSPTQTSKTSDASQFKVLYIRKLGSV